MADGFKKHFNSTTINGRANVAKATYATFALYFLYRFMRRGPGKAKTDGQQPQVACKYDKDAQAHDCPICSEGPHNHLTECDEELDKPESKPKNGCDDEPPKSPPPPPSPPSPPPSQFGPGASSVPRRKCPCEEAPKRAESAVKMATSSRDTTNPFYEHLRPARELAQQMHTMVYNTLRTVLDAVMERAAVTTGVAPSTIDTASDEHCDEAIAYDLGYLRCPAAAATAAAASGATEQTPRTRMDYGRFCDGFAADMCYEEFED